MPAPAPQATSSRRCHSGKPARSPSVLAIAAPACCGAASRPSEAPSATITIECTARAKLASSGRRACRSHSASETSEVPKRESATMPSPATTPPIVNTITRCAEELCSTAFRNGPEL